MKFTETEDIPNADSVFTLRIKRCELADVKLHKHDRALIHECEKSPKVSDRLLALEILARRIEALNA